MNFAESARADSRQWRVLAVGATLIATVAIVMTYPVLSNMYDEPAHLAAGMEWLDRGSYTLERQQPPLARVLAALLPWLDGAKATGNPHMFTEGRAVLGRGDHYWRVLTLARVGMLPFFFCIAFLAWHWTRRLSDERTAAIAVGFVVTNPNLLAHAGVVGTDSGPAALMPAALLVWTLWLLRPGMTQSLLLGVVVALCGLTKFSAAAYLVPAAAGVALAFAAMRPGDMLFMAGARRLFRPLLVAIVTGAMVTWAMYRFHVGPVGGLTMPAPEFWIGLREFFQRASRGHPAYLFGETRTDGWWYYDLVALTVKTPIPLLLFGALGAWRVVDSAWRAYRDDAARALLIVAPVIGIAAVVALASAASVDLGVRLDLPVYPLLAVLAAIGVAWCIERARTLVPRVAMAALGCWMLVTPVASQPEHVAYFNFLAGPDPARVLVDSNLDWGQDLEQLRLAEQELEMDSLRVHYFGTAEFAALGFKRTRRLRPDERATGWVAASETFYRGVWADSALSWLQAYEPVGRVGGSIRLYYITPAP